MAYSVAPPWKRVVAGLLDSLPVLILALPSMLAGRRKDGSRSVPGRRLAAVAAIAASGAYEIPLIATQGRTLGQRMVGIRVVDEGDGTVPTVYRAAVRWALASAPQGLARLVPMSAGAGATMADLQPEIDRLRRDHHRDRRKLNRALMTLFEEQGVNPARDLLAVLVRVLPALALSGAIHAPALLGPRHRGLHDRVAGTIVVQVS